MNYDNYMELYEAVYMFSKISNCRKSIAPVLLNYKDYIDTGITESIYNAVIRILVTNDMLDYDGMIISLTDKNISKQNHVLENIIKEDLTDYYIEFYNKAINKNQFFFHSINSQEYEIYSRCNFPITFSTGLQMIEAIDFTNKKVLELGGNSGGLGTAVMSEYDNCSYTIVDTDIPCKVGNEFNRENDIDIKFVIGDIFDIELQDGKYDYIIMMNLLHDFDDKQFSDILKKYKSYSNANTKFLIIEDVLENFFEPKEMIMHGLRLSVECRGGRQRTKEEMNKLFETYGYIVDKSVKLNDYNTMLVVEACSGQE